MPDFFEPILWILFVTACVITGVVILLQEGKGGGLGEAFGGVGQQAFGVKAEGIQKFTGWVAFSVVVLAILLTLSRSSSTLDLPDAAPPAVPEGAVVAPPPDGGETAPNGDQAPAPAPGDGAQGGDQGGGN